MKPGSYLILAFFASAILSPAQEKAPGDRPPEARVDAPLPSASQPPAAPAPADAQPPMTDSYVIGSTDVPECFRLQGANLSGTMLVRPDGMISVPLLGDVVATGKTPLKLAAEITEKLKKFIQDPNVTVTLTGMNSKRVYMIGEIGRSGPLEMTPGMTLLQAIATAGGLGPFANSKKIYILRNDGGKQQKIPVQYKKALRGDSSLNLILIPGDTIVVP